MKKTYKGSCHCGAVKFTADIDFVKGTQRCNCSICTKARTWFAGVGEHDLKVVEGENNLSDYSWTPPGGSKSNLHYRFCKTCGIRTFAKGFQESLGGVFYAVAIGALDNVANADDIDALATTIKFVDGRHDEYSKPPKDTRLM
ncbi:MAG TPA: GFA family protein [Xanthobacteraceae bacterium]|nr:GFA family protein [Xanthobacteraceae bacterium]